MPNNVDLSDGPGVVLYKEAMLTFRSVMTSSVSTATALFAGTLTILGFAVEGEKSAELVWLSAAPMVAMSFLFWGWRRYNRQAAWAVRRAGINDDLTARLGERPGRFLVVAPLAVAGVLAVFGFCVNADDDDGDDPAGRCVIESPASGRCSVPGP